MRDKENTTTYDVRIIYAIVYVYRHMHIQYICIRTVFYSDYRDCHVVGAGIRAIGGHAKIGPLSARAA